MNFVKSHIKEILAVVIVLFALNRCTVACNRDSKLSSEIANNERLDSTIKANAVTIDSLKRDITEYQNRLGIYTEFNKERQKSDSINARSAKEQADAISALRNELKRNAKNNSKKQY